MRINVENVHKIRVCTEDSIAGSEHKEFAFNVKSVCGNPGRVWEDLAVSIPFLLLVTQ